MTVGHWLCYLLTEVLISLTPGPAVLLVLAQGLTRGPRPSLHASLGILTGNMFYFTLSATSLGALIAASFKLFLVVKWLGAGYLVYLGVSAFLGKSKALSVKPAEVVRGWRTFVNGLLLQLGNPKCLLFFVVVLPQFIDPHGDLVSQILLLGATSIVAEFFILGGYGLFAGRFYRLASLPRFAKIADRLAGSCLIMAGLLAATARRI